MATTSEALEGLRKAVEENGLAGDGEAVYAAVAPDGEVYFFDTPEEARAYAATNVEAGAPSPEAVRWGIFIPAEVSRRVARRCDFPESYDAAEWALVAPSTAACMPEKEPCDDPECPYCSEDE